MPRCRVVWSPTPEQRRAVPLSGDCNPFEINRLRPYRRVRQRSKQLRLICIGWASPLLGFNGILPSGRRFGMGVTRPGVAVTGLYSGPGPLPEPPIGVSAFGNDPSREPASSAGRGRAAGAMMLR